MLIWLINQFSAETWRERRTFSRGISPKVRNDLNGGISGMPHKETNIKSSPRNRRGFFLLRTRLSSWW